MKPFIGLDFGTSNSAASINLEGEVRLISLEENGGKTLKSVIFYDEEEKRFYFGDSAVVKYIENDAYGRYMQSIKSFLPDQLFDYTEIGRRKYKLDDLIAMILRFIKNKAEEESGLQLDRVVIGRPVVFSEQTGTEKLAIDRLISAVEKAGFNHFEIQYEPVAAVRAIGMSHDFGKNLIVGDFGGGTSDFTIIKTPKNIRDIIEPLAVKGVSIGGNTFDSDLMWEKLAYYFGRDVRVRAVFGDFDLPVPSVIMHKLKQWHWIPQLRNNKIKNELKEIRYLADKPQYIDNLINLIENNYGYMLFRSIEKAKCELSGKNSSVIEFNELNLNFKKEIHRPEFEIYIAVHLEKIRVCISDCLTSAGLLAEEIDYIFLTGGSSLIPVVRKIFTDMFPTAKMIMKDSFTSVAYGLGLCE
jgi:hypothetical chaperone protein